MRTTLGNTQRAALTLGAAATVALIGFGAPAQAATGQDGHHGQGSDQRSTSLKDGKGHNDDWQAQSDPDGDENGGVDQPGGSGGVNKADQDGNNGSGNDSDCEDDNRGQGVPGHCKDKENNGKPGENGKPDQPSTDEPSEPGQPGQPGQPSQPGDDTPAQPSQPGDGTPAQPELPAQPVDETPVLPGEETPALPGGETGTDSTPTAPTTPVVLGNEESRPAGRTPATVTAADRPATEVAPAASTPAAVLPNTGVDSDSMLLLGAGLAMVTAGTVLVRRRRVEA